MSSLSVATEQVFTVSVHVSPVMDLINLSKLPRGGGGWGEMEHGLKTSFKNRAGGTVKELISNVYKYDGAFCMTSA